MAARYKWFNVGLPCDFGQLAASLQRYRLSESIDTGFSIDRIEPKLIAGNLMCRGRLKLLQAHSDGSTSEEIVSTITLSPFSIFTRADKNWLRLCDPPRSTREITNALERAIGMGFFVEAVTFSQEAFSLILNRLDGCRLMSTKGIAALHESNAMARIELASKDGIVLERIPLLRGLDYVVDTAAFEVTLRREKGQVSFSKSGLVRINGRLAEHVLKLIEDTLT